MQIYDFKFRKFRSIEHLCMVSRISSIQDFFHQIVFFVTGAQERGLLWGCHPWGSSTPRGQLNEQSLQIPNPLRKPQSAPYTQSSPLDPKRLRLHLGSQVTTFHGHKWGLTYHSLGRNTMIKQKDSLDLWFKQILNEWNCQVCMARIGWPIVSSGFGGWGQCLVLGLACGNYWRLSGYLPIPVLRVEPGNTEAHMHMFEYFLDTYREQERDRDM